RCKTWENKSDAGLAEAIANDHGLTPAATAPGPTYDVVQQWNVSDLAFLRERARLIQAELWVQDDTLHFKNRGARGGNQLTLISGNELIECQLRADLAHQRTGAAVSGYEASKREKIEKKGAESDVRAEAPNGRI